MPEPTTHNLPAPLNIYRFDQDNPLAQLLTSTQAKYVYRYLRELGATYIVEEPNYFDRDFLAEFTAFYGRSASGYSNLCRRLHFFSGPPINRGHLVRAARSSKLTRKRLQQHYLGFVVLRPIPAAPFGRTVLAWYPDRTPDTPRVTTPSRDYYAHLLGMELKVPGISWQQQDTGVGACATIALWTMLHSSAFDDHHAIPTTAEITRSAHRTASLGARVFPSRALRIEQICEAIKEHKLAPMLLSGDSEITTADGVRLFGFSRERFCSACAAFVRSGYPILVAGRLLEHENAGHAVCVVGFRSCPPRPTASGEVSQQDVDTPYLYIHDDNIGPNVRFAIEEHSAGSAVVLRPSSPAYSLQPDEDDPLKDHPTFFPEKLLTAVHEEIRTSSDHLNNVCQHLAKVVALLISGLYKSLSKGKHAGPGLSTSISYFPLTTYLADELEDVLTHSPKALARTRMTLAEKVPPMSLHLGVARIGLADPNATPLVDILFDTTDSDGNHPAFAYVYFDPAMKFVMPHAQVACTQLIRGGLGVAVDAT